MSEETFMGNVDKPLKSLKVVFVSFPLFIRGLNGLYIKGQISKAHPKKKKKTLTESVNSARQLFFKSSMADISSEIGWFDP